MCVFVCMCMYAPMHEESRDQCEASCSITLHLVFETELSLALELTNPANLTDQAGPGIFQNLQSS